MAACSAALKAAVMVEWKVDGWAERSAWRMAVWRADKWEHRSVG
jgi:hypothetical protein